MRVEGVREFRDYAEAEKFCDERAGDCQAAVAIVGDTRDCDPAPVDHDSYAVFLVMDYMAARSYADERSDEEWITHDGMGFLPVAEIIYVADSRPEDERE
jgi:hypothetical protein